MKKKRLLVVDDDQDLLTIMKKQLRSVGFECLCATTVEEGLKTLKRVCPDLVILDLGFQRTDGTAFLDSARKWLPRDKKMPPVILLTGILDWEVIDYALKKGAVSFVIKPYQITKLVETVNRHLH